MLYLSARPACFFISLHQSVPFGEDPLLCYRQLQQLSTANVPGHGNGTVPHAQQASLAQQADQLAATQQACEQAQANSADLQNTVELLTSGFLATCLYVLLKLGTQSAMQSHVLYITYVCLCMVLASGKLTLTVYELCLRLADWTGRLALHMQLRTVSCNQL